MSTNYTNTKPPFNFLGNFTESQKTAFNTWATARAESLTDIQRFYQIRAQQLRKTAGALDTYYSTQHVESLATNFTKDSWQPGSDGHFSYPFRDDQQPMVAMSEIKKHLREQLNRQDEAVFFMNHVRRIIEKNEDLAQHANEGPTKIKTLLARIDFLFSQPEYQATLVKDVSDQYKGEQRYRTNQLDPPTPWEIDNNIG
jgi:hypothetical protein